MLTDAANGIQSHPEAERFLREDTAFRLGALLTESPHPKTLALAETLQSDLVSGLRVLLSVDEDIGPVAQRVMGKAPAFALLRQALTATLDQGGRIFFTGCGATGRLSILLEAAWRDVWDRAREGALVPPDLAADLRERVVSVMAGGDFALIRSVEGFEDFPDFGRHQLREHGAGPRDLVVAVTEGGETPFVIGTAWQGLAAGCRVFFVFNNPAELLRREVRRSRDLLDEPRIVPLDLTTGPMAVSGSTRMQAVTCELLVLGTALERTVHDWLLARGTRGDHPFVDAKSLEHRVSRFMDLRAALASPGGLRALASMVELEEAVYRAGGRVTYFTSGALLDVLTDTTERSPTFMIPPFRPEGDDRSPPSWAFVKNPLVPTPEAWRLALRRPPRGLTWTADTYAALAAPEALRRRAPDLSADQVLRFRIGHEPDPSRVSAPDSAAVLILSPWDADRLAGLREAWERQRRPFRRSAVWNLGCRQAASWGCPGVEVPWTPAPSPLNVEAHLLVKLVMNTVSTATMGRLGRLVGNGMVWVNPSNKKLVDRGARIIVQQTGLRYEEACHLLYHAMDRVTAMREGGEEPPSPVALAIRTVRGRRA